MDITLEEYVRKIANGRKVGYREIKETMEKVKNGELLIEDPYAPKSFTEYLKVPAYSAWLWASLAIVGFSLFSIYITSYLPILLPLRYVLGSLLVLFMPGYSLVEALYPLEGDLSPLERLALSIGLSLALVPLIGLMLNYTPWGIRLFPVATALSFFVLLLLFFGAMRKYKVMRMLQLKASPFKTGRRTDAGEIGEEKK